jgi:hypothetical protein
MQRSNTFLWTVAKVAANFSKYCIVPRLLGQSNELVIEWNRLEQHYVQVKIKTVKISMF